MSWRFRRSFRVIPGLRLNLSKSGLSASIGGAPFTLNLSERGLMGTASIPGTGISYRQHFDNGSPAANNEALPHLLRTGAGIVRPIVDVARPSIAPIEEIRSASTELLTSESLKEMKKLMQLTFEEREDIQHELDTARTEQSRASKRFKSWERGYPFKRIFKEAFARRKSEAETATAKVAELNEQLQLTTVATHIEIANEQADPYFRMRDSFAALCECKAIWDIKSHQATDKFHERTTASIRVDRKKVSFSVGSCDLIQWDQKVPRLENAKGGELFFYPGFILYRAARQAFSVIGYHDVNGKAICVSFQEQESVPSDAKVLGQTWAKANKDGTRDRRFADNYQIPIVQYGAITFKSQTGLWEEFEFSNPERLLRFLEVLNEFTSSFQTTAPQAAQ